VHDTRFAWRGMVRSPGVTAAIALTLAIGIGATTAVWSISDALMRRSLPIDRPGELYAIQRVGIDDDNYRMSYPRFQRFRTDLGDSVPLAAMAAIAPVYARIGEQPEQLQMQLVSGEWFKLLGIGAATGRVLSPADNRTPGDHPVVVLSHAFWTRRFGSDPAIVGRAFAVHGHSFSVIGVGRARISRADRWAVGRHLDPGDDAASGRPSRRMRTHLTRIRSSRGSPRTGFTGSRSSFGSTESASATIGRRLEARFRVEQQEEFATRDSASRARAMR
jgi:hypothetical protein